MDNPESGFSTQPLTSEEIAALDAFLNINCVACTQEETVTNIQRYLVKDLDVFRQTIGKIKKNPTALTLPEELLQNIDHFLKITNWPCHKEIHRRIYPDKKLADKPPKPKLNPHSIFNLPNSDLTQSGISKTLIEAVDDLVTTDSDKQNETSTEKDKVDESSSRNDSSPKLSDAQFGNNTKDDQSTNKQQENQEIHSPSTSKSDTEKKRKASLYCIEKPRNIKRFAGDIESGHVKAWNPNISSRGYGIIVSGPGYYPGVVYNLLGVSRTEFGQLKNLKEEEKQAIVIATSPAAQEAIADVCNNEGKGLIATPAFHRFPIIKFSVNKKLLGTDPNLLVQEVFLFNLKNFLKMKFEFVKTYSPKGSAYANVLVLCAPRIREFIALNLRGMLWVRSASVQVSDHFDLKRCYSCGSCSHRWCTRQNICLRCSGPHKTSRCQNNIMRCPTCSGNHRAFSLECDKMIKAIDREMDKVDYTYTTIMAGIGF